MEYTVGVVKEVKANGVVIVDIDGVLFEASLWSTVRYTKSKHRAKRKAGGSKKEASNPLQKYNVAQLRALVDAEGLPSTVRELTKVLLRKYLLKYFEEKGGVTSA